MHPRYKRILVGLSVAALCGASHHTSAQISDAELAVGLDRLAGEIDQNGLGDGRLYNHRNPVSGQLVGMPKEQRGMQ